MTESTPSFKRLEDCAPRDLIRINVRGRTEWALIGTRNERLLLVCVLSGPNVPYLFDAANDMGIVRAEYEYPVLWYGQAYSLRPDHTGPCDVNSGALFGAHGAIVQSDPGSGSSFFLCCEFPERGAKKGYYNIGKGGFSGEPGGMKACY